MPNIFMKTQSHNDFTWETLGDIAEGRTTLGDQVPVLFYRVLQYSINDILNKKFGQDVANDVFRAAGALAGREFTRAVADTSLDLDSFLAQLQEILRDYKIGILRMEKYSDEDGSYTLTVAEDLDCSGLPITNEVVCTFDEGFLEGIFEAYTKQKFVFREVDCWASGHRACRFVGTPIKD